MTRRRWKPHHDLVYWPFRAALGAGSVLPLGVLRSLGRTAGALALGLAARDRRRAREHLRLAFPELDPRRREAILHATARHLGETLAEVVWLWRAGSAAIRSRTEVHGLEHLRRTLEAGRGAVLVTAHAGNWEWLNAILGLEGIPMTIAVREVYDPRLNAIARRLRSRFGAEVVERGQAAGRALVRALLRNRVVGLLIDQDIRRIPGTFVPFFGRPAWTPTGAAQLALAVRAPVVPAFIHRRPGGSHLVEVHPPLPWPDPPRGEDAVRCLTAAATACIEAHVRAHPGQWVWMHRRWRTRPPEAPPA